MFLSQMRYVCFSNSGCFLRVIRKTKQNLKAAQLFSHAPSLSQTQKNQRENSLSLRQLLGREIFFRLRILKKIPNRKRSDKESRKFDVLRDCDGYKFIRRFIKERNAGILIF